MLGGQMPAIECHAFYYKEFIHMYSTIWDGDTIILDLTVI